METNEKPVWNKEKGRHEIDGINYDGHFLAWKLEYSPKTYLKESQYSGDEWRKVGWLLSFPRNKKEISTIRSR
jgi:hypothetical protein